MKQRFPAYTYINLDSGWYTKFKLGCHDRLQPFILTDQMIVGLMVSTNMAGGYTVKTYSLMGSKLYLTI